VMTAEGYRYWVTFIDACTKVWAIMFLKKKSDTLIHLEHSKPMLRIF
jgi:hypothetical protein